MISRRRTAALLVLPAAFVTACSSSGGGSGGSGVAAGMPTDAAGLGQLLQSATSKITSAHVDLEITLSGQQLTGSGDETLQDGKLTGLDLTETLPGGQGAIEVVVAAGKTYAKLPASLNSSDTPWLLVTSDSSNQVIQQLASSLDTALSSASLGSVSTFTKAAKSVEGKGTQSIGGVETTHYKIVVDVSKLPADMPGKSELEGSGLKEIPIDLYVDGQGRPVQIGEALSVQGTTVTTKAAVTNFNKPVTITAPPANQVGH
jgi:hypothetical protein